MKYLTYILLCIIGFTLSFYIYNNGEDFSSICVLTGFWTGYFGHMILNWSDNHE